MERIAMEFSQKPLLPRVKKEIFQNLIHTMTEKGQRQFIEETLSRMIEENRELAAFLYTAYKHWHEVKKEEIELGVSVMLYRALESQAEADWMEEDIKI